jgi:hypothetical protein
VVISSQHATRAARPAGTSRRREAGGTACAYTDPGRWPTWPYRQVEQAIASRRAPPMPPVQLSGTTMRRRSRRSMTCSRGPVVVHGLAPRILQRAVGDALSQHPANPPAGGCRLRRRRGGRSTETNPPGCAPSRRACAISRTRRRSSQVLRPCRSPLDVGPGLTGASRTTGWLWSRSAVDRAPASTLA